MSFLDKYIDVILPLPVKGTFTYLTEQDDLRIGQRVVVQFGARKLYTALVKCIHNKEPNGYKAKPLLAIIDEQPIVNDIQIRFWEWIADYYMCNLGDVMNAALPASFKLASESKIIMHYDFDGEIDHLSVDENNLIDILSREVELSISDISKLIKKIDINTPEIFLGIGRLITNDNEINQPFLSDV